MTGVSGGRGCRGALAVAAALVSLAAASHAQAAVRYAAPAGSGTACSQASPCDIDEAINEAGSADEVIVNPGSYEPIVILTVTGTMDVHGASGAAVPELTWETVGDQAGLRVSGSARVADLALDVTSVGTALSVSGDAVAERILARIGDNGSSGTACLLFGGALLRDSACWAPNEFATAVQALASNGEVETVTLRNVTAIGAPMGLGLLASTGHDGTELTVDAKNSIFRAGGDEDDVFLLTFEASEVEVVLQNSNWETEGESGDGTETITSVGGNQSEAPLFNGAATGDFRQAEGSPTIDAGTADDPQLGPLDLDRQARNQGEAPDIGAYEDGVVDVTPPQTVISKGPKGKTRKRRARFAFSADENANFQCKLNKRAFKPCASPKLYRGLKRGRRHSFQVRAIDEAGNVDATPAKRSWRVTKPKRKRR